MEAYKHTYHAFALLAAASGEMPQAKTRRHNPAPYVGREVGRNELCLCGSGKKYKKCCMRKKIN